MISGFTDGPFIDTDAVEQSLGPHIYIQVDVAKDMAKQTLGMVEGDEHQRALQTIADLETRIQELETELEETSRNYEAIERLESAGYVKRKKPGRPAKEKVTA